MLSIITFIILCFITFNQTNKNKENFNEQTGRFCMDCMDKTFNQCTQCFNCSWCVDKWGNGNCIGGDINGPYNAEKCALYYNGDPWSRMVQNNDNYKCSYGPPQENRIIGINPNNLCSI
jgi:hypothetical protein